MRRRLLRDYLAALVLTASSMLVGCSSNDGSEDLGGLPNCNPDMNPRAGSLQVSVADPGDSFDCQVFCAQQIAMRGEVAGELSSCTVQPELFPDAGDPDAGTFAEVTCPIITFGCGRRTDGLSEPLTGHSLDEVGAYLARAAYLEAVSVVAFERLADELLAHEAPGALIGAARRAAEDERRHARAMKALARAHGASVTELEPQGLPLRALDEIALENVVEGVVGETFGAAIALHQAAHAGDVVLARAMRAIAVDEARHAELALSVDRWVRARKPGLGPALDAIRREAAARVPVKNDLPVAARRALGVPCDLVRGVILRRLRTDLWS